MSDHFFNIGDEVSYKGKRGIIWMQRYNGQYDLIDPDGDGPHTMLAKEVPEPEIRPVTSIRWYPVSYPPLEGEQVFYLAENRKGKPWRGVGTAIFRNGRFEEEEFGDDLLTIRDTRVLKWAPVPSTEDNKS